MCRPQRRGYSAEATVQRPQCRGHSAEAQATVQRRSFWYPSHHQRLNMHACSSVGMQGVIRVAPRAPSAGVRAHVTRAAVRAASELL